LLGGIVVLVLVGSLALDATMIGESLPTRGLLAAAADLAAFAVTIGGYAALFSSFSSERGRPAAIAAGLTTSIRFTPWFRDLRGPSRG
jgi:ABC-2 type transport system permease protein